MKPMMKKEKRKREANKSSLSTTEQTASKSDLPISEFRSILVDSIREHQTTIITAETGAGKSTQLPQYLADAFPNDCIVCTQPRRVAAVTIAQRVADERRVILGQEVGYSIRFEDKTSRSTRIKFVTDGVLLRETMSNPDLSSYKVVILDEAHERSLQTDILMGLLRQLQERRADLRIVIMSATLQADIFKAYFQDSNIIAIPGRQFPVEVFYTKHPEADFVDTAMRTCLQIHEEEEEGGVLVFLPGQDDIESLQLLLQEYLPTVRGNTCNVNNENPTKKKSASDSVITETTVPSAKSSVSVYNSYDTRVPVQNNVSSSSSISSEETILKHQHPSHSLDDFELKPLYAAMPPDEQLQVFQPSPPGVRKFILSTNIAETSVTISGIKYVIDTGFVKTRLLHVGTGFEMLKVIPVSKSQANQRGGRAGRECPGKCFRLYDEKTFETLEDEAIPEIQRVNIAQVILQMKVLGIPSPQTFPYLSAPPMIAFKRAMQDLVMLGALDSTGELSSHGRMMAALPLDPIYANLLLKSKDYHCTSEILTAVSLLSADNIFLQPHRQDDKEAAYRTHKQFSSKNGDLVTLINVYQSWLKAKKDKTWARRSFVSQRALQHACSVRQQLVVLLQQASNSKQHGKGVSMIDVESSCLPEYEPLLRCLATGFFMNAARRTTVHASSSSSSSSRAEKGTKPGIAKSELVDNAPYVTLRGNRAVHIHPSSVLFSARKLPEYVVFSELLITSKEFMRSLTVIENDWLLTSGFFQSQDKEKISTRPSVGNKDHGLNVKGDSKVSGKGNSV